MSKLQQNMDCMPSSRQRKAVRSVDMLTDARKARLEEVLRKRQPDFTIVIENIWDPHNVSAILRSADAVGIQDVHLLYYIEEAPDFAKIGKQSSASAKKWLTFHSYDSVETCFEALRAEGFSIYASHVSEYSMSLHDLDGLKKLALVFGNEHRGVSETACNLADGVFYIPMMGMVESLNASVATAVSLYEIARQRIAAGRYSKSLINEGALQNLLKEWARK
jgi:tRNA (guanosine-2'-O-)-methyltransferase